MLFIKDLPRGQLIYTVAGIPLLMALTIAGMIVLPDAIPYGIVPLFVTIFLPLAIADFAKAKAKTVTRTHRRIEIRSPITPDMLYAKLAGAEFGRFRLRDRDAGRRVLLLEAPMRGWSLGFHVPVFVRDAGIGSTIEIGIMPKVIQHVATVEEWHKKAAAEVEKALAA